VLPSVHRGVGPMRYRAVTLPAATDRAAYTGAAARDPLRYNSLVSVAGDRRKIVQMADDYAFATGRTLQLVRWGSIAYGYPISRRCLP